MPGALNLQLRSLGTKSKRGIDDCCATSDKASKLQGQLLKEYLIPSCASTSIYTWGNDKRSEFDFKQGTPRTHRALWVACLSQAFGRCLQMSFLAQ